ncbi:MAG: hypothetical protein M3O90_03475 [Actinomycetota bacterium]|nr:hypothetical protein [Actinomycetota bacterium]
MKWIAKPQIVDREDVAKLEVKRDGRYVEGRDVAAGHHQAGPRGVREGAPQSFQLSEPAS